MGEEEIKKPEEKNEEPKAEKAEESKGPPPLREIVLTVYMHCEGCARKVRRSLKGFEGVEHVQTDCKTHKVVVKGEKADPLKVVERVQRKCHRQVELLSPIPEPPPPEDAKKEEPAALEPEKKKEELLVITVVLKVHMHCEACAQEIKRRIAKMQGVENVESDLKSSEVTVKGVFEVEKLVEYVFKRTGKHAKILKVEPEKKVEEKEKEQKEEKMADQGGEKAPEKTEEKKEDVAPGTEDPPAPAVEGEGEAGKVEVKKNEYYHNYSHPVNYQIYPYGYLSQAAPRFDVYGYPPAPMPMPAPALALAPPPQMFSDENPNACSVM